MSGTNPKAFDPKVVLGLVLVGAIAFVATLYFIGTGNTGRDINNGGAHASAKGLNGFAGLATLLEESGHEITFARSPGRLEDEVLVILTPTMGSSAEDLSAVIENRRYVGPTLVILPKWFAFRLPPAPGSEAKDGWVELVRSYTPDWASELDEPYALDLEHKVDSDGSGRSWQGLGYNGNLPEERYSAQIGTALQPLIRNGKGEILAGYVDDDGYYPALAEAAGFDAGDGEYLDSSKWGVVFVIDPDLMNNYGLADRNRAEMAHALVDTAMEGEDLDIVFDLTLNGLGASQNLLTLAFTPPFLAATLCLILALIVVAWRAFRRFGPPVTEGRSIAFGKARLVENSAGFVQRSKRLHLLSIPYANMIRDRLSKTLGLRHPDDEAIANTLSRRASDAPDYSEAADRLRNAKTKQELLRAAAALRSIERTLEK